MKTIIFDRFGDIEVLKLADMPKPIPKKDEVLVKVKACALNPL